MTERVCVEQRDLAKAHFAAEENARLTRPRARKRFLARMTPQVRDERKLAPLRLAASCAPGPVADIRGGGAAFVCGVVRVVEREGVDCARRVQRGQLEEGLFERSRANAPSLTCCTSGSNSQNSIPQLPHSHLASVN